MQTEVSQSIKTPDPLAVYPVNEMRRLGYESFLGFPPQEWWDERKKKREAEEAEKKRRLQERYKQKWSECKKLFQETMEGRNETTD